MYAYEHLYVYTCVCAPAAVVLHPERRRWRERGMQFVNCSEIPLALSPVICVTHTHPPTHPHTHTHILIYVYIYIYIYVYIVLYTYLCRCI
jgi:hypothetical protein